jgi:pimeloyl-ACP methyl ester carboxylesterase
MIPRTREERETIIRFDVTDEPAHLWTARVIQRRRWERLGQSRLSESRERPRFRAYASVVAVEVHTKRRSLPRRMAPASRLMVGTAPLLLLAGFLSNLAVATWQHLRNPVPGSFYTVDGRVMHLFCTGAGPQTVVIEVAASADWLGWQGVQPRLSQLTRVCTYDRAGHGWSEPRQGPRDAEAIVRDLHALLDRAGVPRPLVLTGHSAGGLYVREYAREFPGDVVGVVLIDSSSPQQIDELPGWRESYETDVRDFARELRWEELRVWSGWERLTGRCLAAPSPELRHLAGQYNAEMCRPGYVGGDESELPYFEVTSRQAARLATFDLSRRAAARHLGGSRSAARRDGCERHRRATGVGAGQEALKALSSRSWRVVARGAGHAVHHDRLDLVVAEMTRLIGYLQGGPAPPFGRTVIE